MPFIRPAVSVLALLMVSLPASAQNTAPVTPSTSPADPAGGARRPPVYKYALAPKPATLIPWVSPNRPHWKLPEILAAHAGQKSWTQPLIRDNAYNADYIQMAPGEKTRTTLYADTDTFWIVQSGQMRIDIDGQMPFVASKGFAVWVPYRTPFSMQTVGDAPSLRYEVTHAGATPLYATTETPPAVKGMKYVRAVYAGAPGAYPDGAKPYLDFNKEVIDGNTRPGRFIPDGSFIRGMSVPAPPPDDQGHFHIDYNEFWFIMEGKMTYQIEGVPMFTADQGDVVYSPHGHFHRTSFAGGGMATRLAIFPQIGMNVLDADHPSQSQPQ
jgi:mannose-6-phosphate isomerase-like protein (cupin superfamily)